MALKNRNWTTRKLTKSIAAGAAAIAVAVGGVAVANSGSSTSGTSTTTAATAGKVVPFQQGQPSPATKVGQVPASFSAGTGTIITGAAADKAKAAAVAAYPGGTVNRVVQQSFKVVGAE